MYKYYKISSLEYTVVYLSYPQNCSPNSDTGLGRVDSSPMILGRVWRLALSDFAFTDLSSSFLNSLVTCGDLQDNPLL